MSMDKFWKYVVKNQDRGYETPCWIWIGAKFSNGYGHLRRNNKDLLAHKVSFEHTHGPVPSGLVLDHLCRQRACVNPDHMEPVTQRQNILRGRGASASNAIKTHCPHGHEYTPENTYNRYGQRYCRACMKARAKTDQPQNGMKTHCKRGHEFTAENTYINKNGSRICRQCVRERRRRKRANG